MKKRVFWKILTMALVLGMTLSLAACGNDNGGGGDNAFIGPELNLSGQVYREEWLEAAPWVRYTRFTGDLQVTGRPVGTGSITGGNLSFTAGSPPASAFLEWCSCGWIRCEGYDCDGESTDDQGRPILSISPADTRWVSLRFETPDSNLSRGNRTRNQTGTTGTSEWVYFIYVDRDATWTGRRVTGTDTSTEGDVTYTETWTQNAFTINLRQGWNAINFREAWTETTAAYELEFTVFAGPGNLRWTLDMWGNYSAGIEALGVEVERPDRARGSMFRAR